MLFLPLSPIYFVLLSRPENDGDKSAHKGGVGEFGFYIDKQENRNILLLDRQAVSMLTA
jgi:hypothetical protein